VRRSASAFTPSRKSSLPIIGRRGASAWRSALSDVLVETGQRRQQRDRCLPTQSTGYSVAYDSTSGDASPTTTIKLHNSASGAGLPRMTAGASPAAAYPWDQLQLAVRLLPTPPRRLGPRRRQDRPLAGNLRVRPKRVLYLRGHADPVHVDDQPVARWADHIRSWLSTDRAAAAPGQSPGTTIEVEICQQRESFGD
jgi:hypothetical protein